MKHFEPFEDTKHTRTPDSKDNRFSVVVIPQTQEEISQQTNTVEEANIR